VSTPLSDPTNFAPTRTDRLRSYGSTMAGSGRWFRWVDDGGTFGIVWTDDRDALGCLGVAGVTPEYQQAAQRVLREGFAAGFSATDQFDRILALADDDVHVKHGELGTLLRP
jgi:hypothetical protein